MNLNKISSFVLLEILNGKSTSAEIAKTLPDTDIRSIQRTLVKLVAIGAITSSGPKNNPSYSLKYESLVNLNIPEKIFEYENRPESHFNHELLDWLESLSSEALDNILQPGLSTLNLSKEKLTAKELEYLTVELAWKSSELEGNTYTLLDTQLLLVEGVKAKNRTEFETQMILNHKDAVSFIVDNPNLFDHKINFSAVEELHKIIVKNLGISTGVRKKLIGITASNYQPLAIPHQLRESMDKILNIINAISNPISKSLLALSLVPYLQLFEDGNKRTGRILANAILISSVGKGFSLRKVSARELALAYLAFYEFNSLRSLKSILASQLN